MLISSTNYRPFVLRIAGVALAVLLASCASQPSQPGAAGADEQHVVSKYAKFRDGAAAGKSNTLHIPSVPHTEEAQQQAVAASSAYATAIAAMDKQQYEKAMALLRSIASTYSLLSGPWVNQGIILLAQEKTDNAKDAFQKAIDINAKNPYAWNGLGVAKRTLGDFSGAKTAYLQAIKLDPLYAKAHFNLAILADLYLDDLPLALDHYKRYQALQKEPDKHVAIWIKDLQRRIKAKRQAPSPAGQTGATPAPTKK